MTNIVDFSYFLKHQLFDSQIKEFSKQLEKAEQSKKKLKKLQRSLEKFYSKLDAATSASIEKTSKLAEKFLLQRDEVSSLLHTCNSLLIDSEVKGIKADAKLLASEPNASIKKINKVSKRIKSLSFTTALSVDHKKEIDLAKKELKYARCGKRDHFTNITPSLTQMAPETAITIYEIAGEIYFKRFTKAMQLLNTLPQALTSYCIYRIEENGGSLEHLHEIKDIKAWSENIYLIVQALIGCVNESSGLTEDTLPSYKEIDQIFSDLLEIEKGA